MFGCIRYQTAQAPLSWSGPATVTAACPDLTGFYLLSEFEALSEGPTDPERTPMTAENIREIISGEALSRLGMTHADSKNDIIKVSNKVCQHVEIEFYNRALKALEKKVLTSESFDNQKIVFQDSRKNLNNTALVSSGENTISFARDEHGCLLVRRDSESYGINSYAMPFIEVQETGWILLPRVNEKGEREINCDL